VTDTTTNTAPSPEQAFGGTGLAASAPDSLGRNVEGACDFLDGAGRWVASGTSPPAGTIFTRRWNIAPLAAAPDKTIVVQVAVFAFPLRTPVVRLVAVRTRKAP